MELRCYLAGVGAVLFTVDVPLLEGVARGEDNTLGVAIVAERIPF